MHVCVCLYMYVCIYVCVCIKLVEFKVLSVNKVISFHYDCDISHSILQCFGAVA